MHWVYSFAENDLPISGFLCSLTIEVDVYSNTQAVEKHKDLISSYNRVGHIGKLL